MQCTVSKSNDICRASLARIARSTAILARAEALLIPHVTYRKLPGHAADFRRLSSCLSVQIQEAQRRALSSYQFVMGHLHLNGLCR